MIASEKPTVDEASVRYQALTKLTELSLAIASARDLNDVADKILLATKIRLWLKGLQYKNYLTRDQRYQIVYALIDLAGIYEFPVAPVLTTATRPSTYINGVQTYSSLPLGGTTNQVLSKRSAANYDADWESIEFPASIASISTNSGTVSSATPSGSISIVGSGSISTSAAGSTVTISGPAGGGVAGSDTQIQFNDAGAFGADAAFTFNKTTKVTLADSLSFSSAPTTATGERNLSWNNQDGTLYLGLKGGVVSTHVGQTQHARVVNGTGTNLLKSQYRVVKVTGAQGQRLQVNLARGDSDPNSADTIGIVAENINNNQEGFIITSGLLTNINTTGSLQGETWVDGNTLYLSPTTYGQITNVKPIGPNHTVILGFVVHSHPTQGKIFVKIDNGYELQELHDCRFISYSNNDIIYRDTSTNVWKNASLVSVLGYTPANAANVISSINSLTTTSQNFAVGASGTDFGIVSAGSTHTFNIPDAGSSSRGLVTTGTQNFAGNKNFTSKISIGSDSNASAAFEVNSTTQGILAPRMTEVQRDAISSPATGLLIYNTTSGRFNYYTGSAWSEFGNVTGTGTNNELAYFNTTGSTISSLSTATYPSLTELSYVKGVTSSIQTQLNSKSSSVGTNDLNKSDGSGGLVQSYVFSTSSGNITLGSGITGSTRTISADGSSSNVSLILQPKGTSSSILRSSDALKSVSASNNLVTISALTSTSGVSAQSQQRTDRLYVGKSTNNNNTVEFPLYLFNESGGSSNLPQVGMGTGLEFASSYVNSLGGFVNTTSGQISFVSTSVTNTLTVDLVVGISSANVINERLRLLSTGQLKLNAYTSSSSFTGTAAGYLAFDSSGNILTVTGGGHVIQDNGTNKTQRGNLNFQRMLVTDDLTNNATIVTRPADTFIGISAPASPVQGDEWTNSETWKTYKYYDSYWVELSTTGNASTGATAESNPGGKLYLFNAY